MRVRFTMMLSDDYRRAIRHRVGHKGKATRTEVILHVEQMVQADMEDMVYHYQNDPEIRRKLARRLNRLGPDLGMTRG
jgi:hypothetical protein